MKNGIVMSLYCDDCGEHYNLKDDKIDEYNVYWVFDPNSKNYPAFTPKLLCPKCTEKAVAKL